MAAQMAIIGCGGMANGHLNAYLTIHRTEPGKVELVAMCDEVKGRADQFADAEVILKDGARHSRENLIAEYRSSLSDEEEARFFPHHFTDDIVLECYDFADAIENNRPPELDAEVGLRAKSICETIYESNACGQAVDDEEVVAGNIEVYQKPINERWNL